MLNWQLNEAKLNYNNILFCPMCVWQLFDDPVMLQSKTRKHTHTPTHTQNISAQYSEYLISGSGVLINEYSILYIYTSTLIWMHLCTRPSWLSTSHERTYDTSADVTHICISLMEGINNHMDYVSDSCHRGYWMHEWPPSGRCRRRRHTNITDTTNRRQIQLQQIIIIMHRLNILYNNCFGQYIFLDICIHV